MILQCFLANSANNHQIALEPMLSRKLYRSRVFNNKENKKQTRNFLLVYQLFLSYMRVKELIIDGFKSYSTRTVITDWDPQFNAITGLNGSGKSNILDAICFVLGITKTQDLRAQNPIDLIYKKGQAGITKASVTLTFDNTDKDKSPPMYKDEKFNTIMITRTITIQGGQPVNKFSINGTKCSAKEVALMLQTVQLNINNPNFLIMQGKITKMLDMKPKQILNLIEEATGTKAYENQREYSKKQLKKKEDKLHAAEDLLENQIKPKMLKLEAQKEIIQQYKSLNLQMEKDMNVIMAFEFDEAEEELRSLEPLIKDLQTNCDNSKNDIEKYQNQIDALNNQIKDLLNQKSLNDSSKIRELEAKAQLVADELTKLKTSKEIKQTELNELNHKLASFNSKLTQLEKSGSAITEDLLSKAESDHDLEQQKLDEFNDLIMRKVNLHSTLSTGFSSSGKSDAGYESQLRELNKRQADCKTSITKDQMKIDHLKSNFNDSKLSKAKLEIENIQSQKESKKRELEKLQDQLRQNGFDEAEYSQLKSRQAQLHNDLRLKQQSLDNFKRSNPRLNFNYQKPYSDFQDDTIRGYAGELFELPANNRDSSLALEIIGGGKLYNVVVDNDKVSTALLQRGRLTQRTTFIPLNKIQGRVIRPETITIAKKMAPNKVDFAMDLIEFTNDVKPAMEYTFGNKFICKDSETAKMITFHPNIKTGSVTLEGDDYDPAGRLSGGSRRVNESLLMKFHQFRDMKMMVNNIQKELNDINKKLAKMDQVSEDYSGTHELLKKIQFQIDDLDRNLLNCESSIFLKSYESGSIEIEKLSQSIELNNQRVNDLSKEIAKTKKDMDEYSRNGSGKIKELESEIKQLKSQLPQKEKFVSDKRMKFNEMKIALDDVQGETESLKEKIEFISSEEIPLLKRDLIDLTEQITSLEITCQEANEAVQEEREKDDQLRKETDELRIHLKNTKNKLDSAVKNSEKFTNDLKASTSRFRHFEKVIKSTNDNIRNEITRQQIIANNANISIEELTNRIKVAEVKVRELESKGAKQDISAQIDLLNSDESKVRARILTIKRDRKKIEETVVKLDAKKTEELETTYKLVSKDFGEIFNVLLPGNSAKLVKKDPNNILEGLEVKVQLIKTWKESLVELSGGQRSLVALALIMSLLKFNPAPLYILDEVDAALDLSHTQSIGNLIKTRFHDAQFIVVSLKEGMFNNANTLFRVKFQDGTSVVTASHAKNG